jgi:hypothetical protein
LHGISDGVKTAVLLLRGFRYTTALEWSGYDRCLPVLEEMSTELAQRGISIYLAQRTGSGGTPSPASHARQDNADVVPPVQGKQVRSGEEAGAGLNGTKLSLFCMMEIKD